MTGVPRLWYFAHVRSYFPSTYANNFQIMKMCAAFSRAGLPVTLAAPRIAQKKRLVQTPDAELWRFYHVDPIFDIAWFPLPYPSERGRKMAHALAASVYALTRGVRLAYTRSEPLVRCFAALRIPVVYEAHQYAADTTRVLVGAAASPSFLGVVCISEALARRLEQDGVPAAKLFVSRDAIDMERFEPRLSKAEARAACGLAPDRPLVCHAGHLFRGRGIETVIDAAAALEDVDFVFAGGYPEDVAYYQRTVDAKGLRNVRFLGFIPHALVPAHLFAADVLVMPYTTETSTHEFMSPMKMFEYMAADRPVVASRFPVLQEVLAEDEALYVPPGDAPALADGIRALLADQSRGRAMAARALAKSRALTWHARAEGILSFISERLAARGAR